MIYLAMALTALPTPLDGVEALEQSIERAKKNLDSQQKLKEMLVNLKELKKRFVKEETSREEAWKMVQISSQVLRLIEREHLEHLFAVEFIEELKVLSSYAKKTSIGIKQ
jgi:hypothetical protein